MKNISLFLLLIVMFFTATAQKSGIEYRTWTERDFPVHFLQFIDNDDCMVSMPYRNHGEAMMGRKTQFELKYSNNADTITFFIKDEKDAEIPIIKRLVKGKYVIKDKNNISDLNSGTVYFNRKKVPSFDRFTVYIVNGKVFRQKNAKQDYYGLVKRTYIQRPRFRKEIEKLDPENCDIRILDGKEAFGKYGFIGANGVIEIVSH